MNDNNNTTPDETLAPTPDKGVRKLKSDSVVNMHKRWGKTVKPSGTASALPTEPGVPSKLIQSTGAVGKLENGKAEDLFDRVPLTIKQIQSIPYDYTVEWKEKSGKVTKFMELEDDHLIRIVDKMVSSGGRKWCGYAPKAMFPSILKALRAEIVRRGLLKTPEWLPHLQLSVDEQLEA